MSNLKSVTHHIHLTLCWSYVLLQKLQVACMHVAAHPCTWLPSQRRCSTSDSSTTSQLVLPSAWLGLRRVPVSRTCHTYTNTYARFLLLAVVIMLLYCGWLVLVLLLLRLPLALSSLLITCNEKTKEEKKNVTKSKESKKLRECSFPQQLISSSAITG